MKKQSQSLILMLLATPMLAGCGGGTPTKTTAADTNETTPAETVSVFNLPDKDWEGKTFTLLSQAQDSVARATVTFTVNGLRYV